MKIGEWIFGISILVYLCYFILFPAFLFKLFLKQWGENMLFINTIKAVSIIIAIIIHSITIWYLTYKFEICKSCRRKNNKITNGWLFGEKE